MLTLEQIKEKYNEKIFKQNSRSILVEYLQYELLDSIFKQKGSENLSFMGGTSIRIVYSGNRFSEDLDFDNFGLSFKNFEKLLSKSVEYMNNKGFITDIRFIKKGAYHCYIKFPDLLFQNKLSKYREEKILVRIDAVLKKKIVNPRIFVLSGFGVYRKILVNPGSVILAQKIIAILDRKRAKSRDFYDVSYLLGMFNPDWNYLKKVYKLDRNDIKNRIIKKANSLNLSELAYDVMPFLINPEEKERILSFREYIEQKL